MLKSALFVYIRDGIVAVEGVGGGIQSAADFALHWHRSKCEEAEIIVISYLSEL